MSIYAEAKQLCIFYRRSITSDMFCLIRCLFGVSPNPVLESFFLLVFMGVMDLRMKPAQFDNLVQTSGNGYGAALIAGIFSAVHLVSLGHFFVPPFVWLKVAHSSLAELVIKRVTP